MYLVVPKPIALSVANLVRGTILSQFPSWRPIAYEFSSKASILSVESIMEDPISINGAFSALSYSLEGTESLGSVRKETYEINGKFGLSELKSSTKFTITHNMSNNFNLLTSIKPVTINVIYLFSTGKRDEDQNRKLVPVSNNIVVFASRHTSVEEISYQLEERPDGTMAIQFKCNNPLIVEQACSRLGEIFTGR